MKSLVIVPVLFLLTACGGLKDPRGEADSPPPAPTPADVKGSWQSTCVPTSSLGISESMTSEIGEKSLTVQTLMGRESDCSLADVELTTEFELKTEVETAGSEKWQATPTLVRIKPLTSLGMSMLHLTKFCGIEDWVKGETREVPLSGGGSAPEGCPANLTAARILSFNGEKLNLVSSHLKTTASGRQPYFLKK